MRPINKFLTIGAIALSMMTAQGAFAATDGSLGATSTGTSNVSLTISQMYQITGLADFAFGTYAGTGNLTANDDVCVYTNDATTGYHVLITDNSSLSAADFSVQNATNTSDIPFTVKWNGTTGTTGNAAVTYNSALAASGANTSSTNCGGSNDANIEISLLQTDLQAAPADSYSSTVTIVVEP